MVYTPFSTKNPIIHCSGELESDFGHRHSLVKRYLEGQKKDLYAFFFIVFI